RYEGGGVKFTTLQSYACTDRYKLKLSCQGAGDGLRLELHYDAHCYEQADAEALLEHYGQLLASAAGAPGQAVGRLELLSQRQREQVLHGYNQTRREYEQGGSVVEMIGRQAYQRPDAVAVVSQRRQLSYGALEARASQLAAELRRRGVGAEQVVGVLLEREVELVVGLLGVMKAGAAYLPLEADYPAGRLAYVIYTSGSTGRPKGVMISQLALRHFCLAFSQLLDLSPGDRALQFASVGFDVFIEEVLPTLAAGATLVLRPDRLLDSYQH